MAYLLETSVLQCQCFHNLIIKYPEPDLIIPILQNSKRVLARTAPSVLLLVYKVIVGSALRKYFLNQQGQQE